MDSPPQDILAGTQEPAPGESSPRDGSSAKTGPAAPAGSPVQGAASTPEVPPTPAAATPGLVRGQPDRPSERLANAVPVALLLAVWFLVTFSYGGYLQRQWLLPALAVAALAAIAALTTAYPRRPRSLSLGVLGLFALYAVWVAVSARWAVSVDSVWDETARTGLYLLVLGIALTFLTDARARRALRYLLLAGALLLLLVTTVRLWTADAASITRMFAENRFSYPVSYPNNAAAVFLVFLWPLVWLATDRSERAFVRALSLGTASGLVCLTVLTQSRGAFWALVLTTIFTFVLTPSRLRTLVFVLVPAGLLVWSFPALNEYWLNGPVEEGGFTAARMLLEAFLVAAGVGLVLSVLERWVHVSTRMKVVFGTIVLVGVVVLSAYGYAALERRVGDPGAWLSESWDRFRQEEPTELPVRSDAGAADDSGSAPPASRFAVVSTSGRWDIWTVAWRTFDEHRLTGVGAGNFVFSHDLLRTNMRMKLRQPHSIELRVLSETGAVGALLIFASFGLGVGGALWPRFSAGRQQLRQTVLRRRIPESPCDDEASADRPAGSSGRPGGDSSDDPCRGPHIEYQGRRWGLDPTEYGWETALVMGFGYWMVHGSVEWLWHMPATTIPPLLMLALAVASVDARAGVMWPRVARTLPFLRAWAILLIPPMLRLSRRRAAREATLTAATADGTLKTPPEATSAANRAATVDNAFSPHRRSDKHVAKRRRRDRRDSRRAGDRSALYPPGPLSLWYRRMAGATALVVFAAILLPFLALRYQELAVANASDDIRAALSQAELAARFAPYSPRPLSARADIYSAAALTAADAGGEGQGALLDALALALHAREQAIERDPAAWSLHYLAGLAALELAAAQEAQATAPTPPAPAGSGIATPAVTPEEVATAMALRDLTPAELTLLARSHLSAAQARNPLSPEVENALAGSV